MSIKFGEFPIYYTQKFKTKKDKNILVGLNWFRNAHYRLLNDVKHHYHDLVRKIAHNGVYDHIEVVWKVYVKNNRTDPHNVRSVLEKFVLDGLVECGVIKDDGIDYVSHGKPEWYVDKDNPRCELWITDLSNREK